MYLKELITDTDVESEHLVLDEVMTIKSDEVESRLLTLDDVCDNDSCWLLLRETVFNSLWLLSPFEKESTTKRMSFTGEDKVSKQNLLNNFDNWDMSRGVMASVLIIFSKCSLARFPMMKASIGDESMAA